MWGSPCRLRENEHLFRYRAQFEGNLLRFVRACADMRAVMTRKSCAVEMCNAILGNHLNFVVWMKHVPCGIVTLHWTRFLKFLRCEKVSKRERNLWNWLWKQRTKIRGIWKWELLLALMMGHATLTLVRVSDEDNSVSQTDNFVNVFNSVTSPPVLSYHCVFSLFLNNVSGLSLNLTFGLKLQVGGIKSVRYCLQTIHFPSWLIATLIYRWHLLMSWGGIPYFTSLQIIEEASQLKQTLTV